MLSSFGIVREWFLTLRPKISESRDFCALAVKVMCANARASWKRRMVVVVSARHHWITTLPLDRGPIWPSSISKSTMTPSRRSLYRGPTWPLSISSSSRIGVDQTMNSTCHSYVVNVETEVVCEETWTSFRPSSEQKTSATNTSANSVSLIARKRKPSCHERGFRIYLSKRVLPPLSG